MKGGAIVVAEMWSGSRGRSDSGHDGKREEYGMRVDGR